MTTHLDPRSLTGDAAIAVEQLSRQRIAEWWTRAGLQPNYPAADGDVVRLLQAVEYSISNEVLGRHLIEGQFGDVAIAEGRRNWSGTDIVRLATFLECRRAWQPGSELHATKKTPYERALENYRASGESHALFNDLERFDLRALLLMLVESDSRQQREALFVAVQIKLESFEITL